MLMIGLGIWMDQMSIERVSSEVGEIGEVGDGRQELA